MVNDPPAQEIWVVRDIPAQEFGYDAFFLARETWVLNDLPAQEM